MKYLNIPIRHHLLLIPLFLFLNGQEKVLAQFGIKAQSLTQQWLAAYSTDFSHGNKIAFYESPNPKGKDIWVIEDMLEVDFTPLLGLNPGDASIAGMKAIINKSDIPTGATQKTAIRVKMFLYDPSLDLGYDPEKKLIEFTTNEEWTNETSHADKFISLHNRRNRGKLNEYHSNRIKEVLMNSGHDFGLFDTWDPDPYMIRKVVVRIEFYYPAKITELRLPGLGDVEPQKLLYASGKNTFDLPAQKKIVDFHGTDGDIYRWQWTNDARLYGTTNQILNIAKVNLAKDSDLELKLDYVFKDPRSKPDQFNPKTFKNEDGSPGILTTQELADRLSMNSVKSIMIDQPQSGMFDVVSNRAARAGALFAVNGAFYDYYYYCLPGVKTSLKVDGKWKYEPDIFNHRNTGALVFKENKFEFLRNEKHDTYIGEETGYNDNFPAAAAYQDFAGEWPNLMSGGHFSELGKPYRFHMPKVNEKLMENKLYFWEEPETFYAMGDTTIPGQEDKGTIAERYMNWNEEEFGIWARIACQRFDTSDNPFSFADAFTPDFFKKPGTITFGKGNLSLSVKDASNLYTAVDYRRYPHEFGLQKRGRTFIAKKDGKLYIMTADGLYVPRCQLEKDGYKTEKEQARFYATTAPGLTIKELSDLSQKLEFDALLNLDGGGSSTFFVNGKGMLQNPYAGTAEGPMQQRYLSTTLMVVPKIIRNNIKRESSINLSYLHFDNTTLGSEQFDYEHVIDCSVEDGGDPLIIPKVSYNDWNPIQALSLTPSLERFTKVRDANRGGVISGTFNMNSVNGTEGAILFALSENGQYEKEKDSDTGKDGKKIQTDIRSFFVVGIGKMPSRLIDVLEEDESIKNSLPKGRRTQWKETLKMNNQSFYAILVNNKTVELSLFANEGEPDAWKKYIDSNWHHFSLFLNPRSVGISQFGAIVDGMSIIPERFTYVRSGRTQDNYFFNPDHVTHAMIGALPLRGSYVTGPKSDLKIDNFMFAVGEKAVADLELVLNLAYQEELPIDEHLKQMGQLMALEAPEIPEEHFINAGTSDGIDKNLWYLQFEEGKGYHVHAVNENQVLDESGKPPFYGLNLWGTWITDNAAKKEVAETAKALDSIVDPITDEPLNANPTLEFGSAGVSHVEEAPDASATNSLTEDTLRHSWNVYPNPASSSLFLDLVLEESTPLDIYLFNLSGQQLFHARSARMERGKNRVDLGEIARRFGGKQQLYTLKVRGNGFAPIDTKVMIK